MKGEEELKSEENETQKELKREEEQETAEEDEGRVRMAPNMGAGGSHPQATSDPGEKEMAEEKETRRPRWADSEDDEGKEEEKQKQVVSELVGLEINEGEEEAEGAKEQERWETTEERLPGLEEVESKQEAKKEQEVERKQKQEREEERRAQEAREEERRAQEAREEERRAQEAREEESRAQEAREEESRAQEAREEESRAQEAREEESRAQEAREEEARAQEEQAREEVKAQEERREERKVEAQEGHDGEEEMTTQENCVETKKEMNSMYEESDVSNRHMTWWRNAWWVRMDNGPHLRTARGRRRVWRAATRAAREARETEQVAGGEREKWEQGTTGRKESNTLHVVFHFPNNGNATATCNRCNNSCSSNDSGSKRRNASTVAACMEEFPETSWTSSTNAQNFSYRLKANESADFVKFAFRYSGEGYVGQPPVNVVDWTLMGAVTPVKNREQCDSRWTSLFCQWVWSSNATLPFHEEGTDVHVAP